MAVSRFKAIRLDFLAVIFKNTFVVVGCCFVYVSDRICGRVGAEPLVNEVFVLERT